MRIINPMKMILTLLGLAVTAMIGMDLWGINNWAEVGAKINSGLTSAMDKVGDKAYEPTYRRKFRENVMMNGGDSLDQTAVGFVKRGFILDVKVNCQERNNPTAAFEMFKITFSAGNMALFMLQPQSVSDLCKTWK